jgi:GT2 family glycosyltransferase
MGQAVATVVIPLFNQVALTTGCLQALVAHTPDYLYDVVLVDNGSTDGTGDLLDSLDGDVTVIRNAANAGFAVACNQGAAAGSGEYVVFLNNDTEPQPGWLDALVGLADARPQAGAIGAKLLFPDGSIQHAGVGIVQDAKGLLLGQHLWYRRAADLPEANVIASVPAVTAACMLTRRSAFEAAGGFDEAYWNGNEDIDLCLRMRAEGWGVLYQPASCVVHHESASGPERWTKVSDNILRFTARWSGHVKPDAVLAS